MNACAETLWESSVGGSDGGEGQQWHHGIFSLPPTSPSFSLLLPLSLPPPLFLHLSLSHHLSPSLTLSLHLSLYISHSLYISLFTSHLSRSLGKPSWRCRWSLLMGSYVRSFSSDENVALFRFTMVVIHRETVSKHGWDWGWSGWFIDIAVTRSHSKKSWRWHEENKEENK